MNDLSITGNTLTMSSREIADLTGKQHKHVIRDVRAMLEELSIDGPVLGHVEVKDARGYTDCFNLNRELTETLITGYSIALRHKVIRRLHELEAGAAPVLPQSLPEALRLAADAIDERNRLQAVVTEQQPKIEALDRIAGATGAMCITDAAKHLQVKPHDLFAWLQEHKWIFRRPGCRHWLAYQERIQSGHLLHKVTTVGTDELGEQRAATQVRVTPKGLDDAAAADLVEKMKALAKQIGTEATVTLMVNPIAPSDAMKAGGLEGSGQVNFPGALQTLQVPVQPSLDQQAAAAATSQVQALIEQLKQQAVIPLTVAVGQAGTAEAAAVPGFATGGQISGPGTGTSDSILARLSNGEFVMRAAAVRHYGPDLLEQLNARRLPRFATGGAVGRVPATAAVGSGSYRCSTNGC